jgi:hypothetical protein
MEDDVAKHLEFVQNTVDRMANHSFLLKGWTITLVAALFALAAKDSNIGFAVLALFPALSFWGLDAYYLRQERLFRKLYGAVCGSAGDESSSVPLFSLDTTNFRDSVDGWFKTLWTPTILAIHGMIVALVIVVIAVMTVLL